MKLTASAELVYNFTAPTQVIGLLQASRSGDQTILSDELVLGPDAQLIEDEDSFGDRRFRACPSSQTSITYTATVDNGRRSCCRRPVGSIFGTSCRPTRFPISCPAGSVRATAFSALPSASLARRVMM
ncbi:hypothetical protein [Bosea caraganae]|uniref:hypothetical protein n=1 Tax=Bosea caraganae TaxID=2763117 RepID=UPI001AECF610|nr:hypothetical protein [Bosea caraganae]